MKRVYKLVTIEKNGQFYGVAIAADKSHSVSRGPHATRRLARLAITDWSESPECVEVKKRLNYKQELPRLSALAHA
jgi:hypothetical protein